MNNNYHTQLKNNSGDTGILNEVASNNHILYQNNKGLPPNKQNPHHIKNESVELNENELDSLEDHPNHHPQHPQSYPQNQPPSQSHHRQSRIKNHPLGRKCC